MQLQQVQCCPPSRRPLAHARYQRRVRAQHTGLADVFRSRGAAAAANKHGIYSASAILLIS